MNERSEDRYFVIPKDETLKFNSHNEITSNHKFVYRVTVKPKEKDDDYLLKVKKDRRSRFGIWVDVERTEKGFLGRPKTVVGEKWIERDYQLRERITMDQAQKLMKQNPGRYHIISAQYSVNFSDYTTKEYTSKFLMPKGEKPILNRKGDLVSAEGYQIV
jgi:hypothetical protein